MTKDVREFFNEFFMDGEPQTGVGVMVAALDWIRMNGSPIEYRMARHFGALMEETFGPSVSKPSLSPFDNWRGGR